MSLRLRSPAESAVCPGLEGARDKTALIRGGGELGALVRAFDWGATELGAMETWPQSLLTAVDICLSSSFPMVVFWGPRLRTLYNNAYRPSFGAKHPHVLGAPAETLWPDAWHLLGPMMMQVLQSGEPTWAEDQLLLLNRDGFAEETYWTFSYSAIRGESGRVEGVFTAVYETTSRVLSERRLQTMQALATRATAARSASEAAAVAVTVLGDNLGDLPSASLYLGDSTRLALQGNSGGEAWWARPTEVVQRRDNESFARALLAAVERGEAAFLDELALSLAPLPQNEGELPRRALILPVVSGAEGQTVGALVIALSLHLSLKESYLDFLRLVTRAIGSAIATARAYEEQKTRAEQLLELDRAKTAFFSNVSHELRTPVTLILGPLHELLSDAREPLSDTNRERLEMVQRSGLRLLKHVNTLLEFARIEAGRVQASYVATQLGPLTAELASSFRSTIESAGLRLDVACEDLSMPVWVDRDMWEKIVLNLLSNAFKFTFAGTIVVTLRAVESHAQLTVRDTGTGIHDDELPHIFERFRQVAHAKQARTAEGSGIGLALVQELVRLHGGRISVQSTLGEGTSVLVELPFGHAHLPSERLHRSAEPGSPSERAAVYLAEMTGWSSPAEQPTSSTLVGPAAAHGSSNARHRVLVVDDNADLRIYLRSLLEPRYFVTLAEDGARALELARQHPPDLVLADVMMPELDGFQLVHALKADTRTADVPVILLSARAGEEATLEGLDSGADDYLVKPFGARELVARVEGAVKLAVERAARTRVIKERMEFEQQLIGIVSHDLRTPLQAIAFSATALLASQSLQARQQVTVRRIVSSTERATRMIHDLLDFTQARLGSGLPITPTPVDLHALTQQAVGELRATEPSREIRVESYGDGHATLDADRMTQVVNNLLGNALSYGAADQAVRVTTQGADTLLTLEVHNHGAPISADALPRLFEPLQRGGALPGTSRRSVGLGLYIVKQIIDAHGGTIAISSTAASGTTVTVELPRDARPHR